MSHPGDSELAALALRGADAPDSSPVAEHVSGCADCRGKVDSLRSVSLESTFHSGESMPQTAQGTAALEAGQQLGRYTILDRIGAGGMGEVYAAYDPQLDRRVALKLLRPDRAKKGAEEARTRLLREAQAMARLSHPNVVAVHDVGVFGDEVFVAMEFVDGTALNEWLHPSTGTPTRPVDEVLAVFVKAGEGLAAAHDAGLVHRDFKPSNVLLGKDGRVRVLDFGLARTSAGDARPSEPTVSTELPVEVTRLAGSLSHTPLHTPLTHQGAIVGTPGYMAPEQLRGEVIDPRVDQFSFCAALYEGLYGERPFKGETVREIIEATLKGVEAPPRDDGRVPARVHAAILRGLSPAIGARFADMRALLAELSPAPARSRVATYGWAAVLVALAGAGAVAAVVRGHQPPPCAAEGAAIQKVWSDATRQALEQKFRATQKAFAIDAAGSTERTLDDYAQRWTKLRTATCEAKAQGEIPESTAALRTACFELRLEETRSLVNLLVHADADVAQNAVAAVSRLGTPESCLDPQATLAAEKLPTDPRERARFEALRSKVVVANALLDSGKYQQALDAAQPLVLDAAASGSHALEADAYYIEATAEDRLGAITEAHEHFNRSARAALIAGDDTAAARAWTSLVYVSGKELSSYPDAEQWADYAEAALSRHPNSPRAAAELALQRSVMRCDQGVYEDSLADAKRALDIHEKQIGSEDPQLVRILDAIAWSASWLGDQELAAATYERALGIATRLYGPEHPDVAHLLDRYATVQVERDKLEDALAKNQRALAIFERSVGPESTLTAASLNDAALIDAQINPEEGLAYANRAVAIMLKVYGPDHLQTATIRETAGELALATGKYDEAITEFEAAEPVMRRNLAVDAPVRMMAVRGLASAKLRQGKAGEAVPMLEEVLRVYEHSGLLEREVAVARMELGRALWESGGDRQRARKLIHDAREVFEKSGARDARMLAELDTFVREKMGGK